ncbi:MAG: hypothetical protein EA387_08800, partial [Nitriliruptor sp.]
ANAVPDIAPMASAVAATRVVIRRFIGGFPSLVSEAGAASTPVDPPTNTASAGDIGSASL